MTHGFKPGGHGQHLMLFLGVFFCALTFLAPRSQAADEFNFKHRTPVSQPIHVPAPMRPLVPVSSTLQRVAVLPLATALGETLPGTACDALNDVLRVSLLRTASFEVVTVEESRLRQVTGRFGWTGGEALPSDFLGYIRDVEGCEAVLFSELTAFDPYGAMVLGLRFRLVDSRTGEILWMASRVFDLSNRSVAAKARRFERSQPGTHRVLNDGWRSLRSPRQFGEFAMVTLLATMPES